MIEGLYPQCLDIGISPSDFWNYSIGEIYDLLESYNRKMQIETEKEEADLKIKIILNSTLARWIGENVACLLDKNAKVTTISEVFPSLFQSEEESVEESKVDMELYKAKMDDYMFRHNSRMKKGEN